jgi:hypothetical protein
MKLGISMLVVGLLFAGFGFFLWNYASLGGLSGSPTCGLPQDVATVEAIGMGMTIFGGGLAIGGIVRMIVKR